MPNRFLFEALSTAPDSTCSSIFRVLSLLAARSSFFNHLSLGAYSPRLERASLTLHLQVFRRYCERHRHSLRAHSTQGSWRHWRCSKSSYETPSWLTRAQCSLFSVLVRLTYTLLFFFLKSNLNAALKGGDLGVKAAACRCIAALVQQQVCMHEQMQPMIQTITSLCTPLSREFLSNVRDTRVMLIW